MKHLIVRWLIFLCVLIISIIVIGGITRLTDSGLSMVEWRPIYGLFPPLSLNEWNRVFQLYQQSPEFIYHNPTMSLGEFKSIFFWEYAHRILGRVIGLVIIIGSLFFYLKGVFSKKDKARSLIMIFLVVVQGLMGWYMVKSGLVSQPNVSHIRLGAHLFLALFLLQFIFWWILDLIIPRKKQKVSEFLQRGALLILILTGVQIMYGAFMAGLKAGYAFNTFPSMGGFFIPPSLFILKPLISNFYDNPIMVQFIHRGLAWSLLLIVILFHRISRKKYKLTLYQTIGIHMLRISTLIQFVLGILTLIHVVPFSLALLHQIGGVLMLSSAVYTVYIFQSN